jgi:polyhydroxyalkanoate synthesis repressor PhaR
MPRLVKRYSNRKLYDTSESRYVTLEEISRWVKAGEDVKIVENESGEDLTAVTFAQIILEEERKKNGYLSLPLSQPHPARRALQGSPRRSTAGWAIRTS